MEEDILKCSPTVMFRGTTCIKQISYKVSKITSVKDKVFPHRKFKRVLLWIGHANVKIGIAWVMESIHFLQKPKVFPLQYDKSCFYLLLFFFLLYWNLLKRKDSIDIWYRTVDITLLQHLSYFSFSALLWVR